MFFEFRNFMWYMKIKFIIKVFIKKYLFLLQSGHVKFVSIKYQVEDGIRELGGSGYFISNIAVTHTK